MTKTKIRWGVLGVAGIATRKVIPAMQQGAWSSVTAIASRDGAKAREAAAALGLSKAYGSYEELLDDPDVDAIYNPLPNHLHVPWTIRAAERGKHVLCEKPIALNAAEARFLQLLQRRSRKHPERSRFRRRRADGYRLLPGQYGAIHLRSRTGEGD